MDTNVLLQNSASAVRQARDLTRTSLIRWRVTPDCVDDAVLIVSEMVTNAIRYGGGPVRLRLRLRAAYLRVEVRDASRVAPRVLPADPAGERGRGLRIVARLASRWGITRLRDGKIVWVDLRCARARARATVDAGR